VAVSETGASPGYATNSGGWNRHARLAALVLAVLVIWGLGAFTYAQMSALIAANQAADHAQQVRYEAERLLSSIKDGESGKRGYIITGDESYLEPYQAAVADAPMALDRLVDLTADNPVQQQRIAVLRTLVRDRLELDESQIALRRERGLELFDSRRLGLGRATMDEIRRLVSDMIADETRLYQERTARAHEQARQSALVLLGGIVLSTLIIAGLYYVMLHEVQRRRRTEGVLKTLNTELEHRVQQRTAEIERSHQFQKAILGNMQDALLVNKDGTVVFANNACLRLMGATSPEQIVGEPAFNLFHPDYHGVIIQRLRALQTPGAEVPTIEEKIVRLDGSILEVEVTAASFRDDTGHAVLVILRDITQRKATERQLNHAQRLEAVGQLTGGVAHDFNNLLTVILGSAEQLEEQLADSHLRRIAVMSRTAAERGAELTNRLLAFSRRQALDPRVTDINKLIAGMDGLLRRTLGEHVEIELVRGGGLWEALIDAPQLENAILNLCLNARDAMPAGGRLTIETANVRLDQSYAARNDDVTPGQYVMVAVSDTGAGMDPDTLQRAFEPFFTTKEVGKGSGLGLSMVYGFTKQSNGHAKIYSEPGQGTAVKLYLPRAETAERTVDNVGADEHVVGGTEKVLLVEDDQLVRDHVAAQLEALGYRVVGAASGPEALRHLRESDDFDLLFTDIVMPGGMNGRQLAEEAHLMKPGLPVLFTSGYTENAIVHHGRLDPGVHLLNKPYRRQELAAKVRQVLAGARE
jgi:PAS domain S-box-containing protein